MADEVLTAAAVQLQSTDDVDGNLARVRYWVRRAKERGAQLVLLPENFAFFGAESTKCTHAEDLERGGPILDTLRELAAATGTTIIAGGMPEQSSDRQRPFNSSVVIDPEGRLLARYRKLHLFDVQLPDGTELRESAATTAGDDVVSFELGGFQIGLAICYDLRFGKLFDALVRREVDVVTLPAAFTDQTGMDHWHPLLRARAIETQCWVIAAAQWGQHPHGRRSYGHSLITDPWGVVVAECSNGEGVIVQELTREAIARVRRRLPCRQHRREL